MGRGSNQHIAPTPYGPFPIEAFEKDTPEGVPPAAGLGGCIGPILAANGTTWELFRRAEISSVRQGFRQQWGYVFLNRDYPLSGYFSGLRRRQQHMPFYSYSSLRRKRAYLAGEPDVPVAVLMPRAKGVLQVLAGQCPVLARAWEIMKLAPSSGHWACVLPDELAAGWVREVSAHDAERFREMWTHDLGPGRLGTIADDPVACRLINAAFNDEHGKRIGEAVAGLRELIARLHQIDQPTAWAWCWMSRLHMKVRSENLMLEAARSAIRADPRCADGWQYAGMGAPNAPRSIRYLARASALDPLNGELHVMCSECLACIPRWGAMVPHLEMALRLEGDRFDLWNRLGHALLELGRLEESVMAVERGLELAPDHPGAWNAAAYLYAHVGRIEEAERLCTRALAEDSCNSAYLDTMGVIKLSTGCMQEARAFFARAVACDRGNGVARAHLDGMP